MLKARKIKGSRQERNFSFFLLVFLLIFFIALLTVANLRQAQRKKELSSKVNRLTDEIQKFQQQKEDFQANILQAEDSASFEEILRENLNLQKEGETTVGFIIEETSGTNKAEQETSGFKKLWQEFLEQFKFK